MIRIVVIENEYRTVRDIKQWMRDLEAEVHFESFQNEETFWEAYPTLEVIAEKRREEEEKMRRAAGKKSKKSKDSDKESESEEKKEDHQDEAYSHIDLIIFSNKIVTGNVIEWITKTRNSLKERLLFPKEGRTKFAVMSYEGTDLKIEKLAHPFVDDVFIKPLDRSLILQKIELILSQGDATSFLYTQKTEMPIQIAKSIDIVALSEYGFVITNPIPLKPGTYMTAHAPIFNVGRSGMVGRCYKSTKHPRFPNGYLCHFAFFGPTSEQIRNVRKTLNSNSVFRNTLQSVQEDPKEVVTQFPFKHVVIIEMNKGVTTALSELLTTKFTNIYCHTFGTMNQFMRQIEPNKNDDQKKEEEEENPDFGPEAFGYSEQFSFLLDKDEFTIRQIEPDLPKTGHILGYKRAELVLNEVDWKNFMAPDRKRDLEDFLEYIASGQSSEMHARFFSNQGQKFVVKIEGKPNINQQGSVTSIQVQIQKLDEDTIDIDSVLKSDEGPAKDELSLTDIFIINGLFVKGELSVWIDNFRTSLEKQLGIPKSKNISFIVLGDEASNIRPDHFQHLDIMSYFSLPLDRRFVSQTLAMLYDDLSFKRSGLFLGKMETLIKIKVAQEVQLREISEYGLTINFKSPLKENIFLNFFSPIFGEANDVGALGKCYHYEPDSSQGYSCSFIFFGVTDVLLKRIRSWIKEEYVSGKESE